MESSEEIDVGIEERAYAEPPRKAAKILQTFSQFKWLDVKKKYYIEDVTRGRIIPDEPDLGKEYVDHVLQQWRQIKRKISEFPGMNEAEMKSYIEAILWVLPDLNTICIRKEYKIEGAEITGCLDYAFATRNPLLIPVVCIIEAKKSDVGDMGRAQIYVQLKSCYELATQDCRKVIEKSCTSIQMLVGAKRHAAVEKRFKEVITKYALYIYGIVSTAKHWLFVRFDGQIWLENTKEYLITDETDEENIKLVSTNIFKILTRQEAFLNELSLNVDVA